MTASYFETANKLKREGKLQEAIPAYQRAIEQNPIFYGVHHNLGEVLAKLNRIDEAVASYQRTIELNPNSAWSYHNLGEVLTQLNRIDEAIIAYRQAVEINPASFLSYYQLGKTFYRLATEINLENFQFSLQLEEVISKTSQENGSSASIESDCFNDITFLQSTSPLNNEAFVEEVYRTYLKRSPDVNGKNSFLQNLGNGTLTRQQILATIRQSGEFTALLRLSGCLMAAISAYRKAIELNPDSYDSYHSLGEALVKMNQLDEAVLVYGRAIELNPNFYKSYSQLGGVLAKQGQLDTALVYQQKAIELQPVLVGDEAYFNLGNIQIQLGRLEEGIVSYQKAIEINPDCAEAHYNLGNVLLVQGKREQAIRSYYQSNKIHCRKANPNATIPGILLVTFPEFGGTEIVNALASSLSIPFIPISGSYPFDNIIERESISRLASGMSWSMGYISASLINLDLIGEYLDKMIFHICDPRQAMLLFVNHLTKILQTEPKQLIMYHSILCDNYFALSLTEQISWHIENGYLPQAIKFLKGWLEVIESHCLHPQLLLTKQEDFAANSENFLKSVLNFYEIKDIDFALSKLQLNQDGYMEKEKIDDWWQVFTQEQTEKSSSIIPTQMFSKFGWNR